MTLPRNPSRSVPAGPRLLLRTPLPLLLVGSVWASPAESQQPCLIPADDVALARHFAPTLVFSPGERHFPTVPFFTAFDGMSNDDGGFGGPGIDFDNPSELLPGLDPDLTNGSVSWDALDSLAHAWDTAQVFTTEARDSTGVRRMGRAAIPAVFYRIRKLTDNQREEVWRFLRKDSQAWRRHDMDEVFDRVGSQELISLEYYQYYLDDEGISGHPQDIEFSFLFLPAEPVLRCEFRMLVGAGHDARTANNVLVLRRDDPPGNPHHITVELGGHASAPSRDRGDGFRQGWDANWHAAEAWGTRDIIAFTGTSFTGPYRAGMTLARTTEGIENTVFRYTDPDIWRRTDEVCDTCDVRDYYLLEVEPFERLAKAIETTCVECAQNALYEIEEALDDSYMGSSFQAPTVTEELLESLQPWLAGLHVRGEGRKSPSNHSIWQHKHYQRSPTLILKDHLYPQSIRSIQGLSDLLRQFTYGLGSVPDREHEVYLGFAIPRIDWGVDLKGVVEVQVGIAFSRWAGDAESDLTLALQYDREYRERLGWYARIAYTSDRDEIAGYPEARPMTVSGGLSLLLFSDDGIRGSKVAQVVGLLPGNIVRLRVGPRFDVPRRGLLDFGRGGVEIFLALRQ